MKRSTKNATGEVIAIALVILLWIGLSLASLAATVFVIVWVLRAMGVL